MAETPEESVFYERQQLHAFHIWYAAYLQQRKPDEIDQIVSNAFTGLPCPLPEPDRLPLAAENEASERHHRGGLCSWLRIDEGSDPIPGSDRQSLSHLSRARGDVEDKGWDLTKMLFELEKGWTELIQHAESLEEEE